MINKKHFLRVYGYFVHWIIGEQEKPVRGCLNVQSDGGSLDHTVEMERGGQSPDISWDGNDYDADWQDVKDEVKGRTEAENWVLA